LRKLSEAVYSQSNFQASSRVGMRFSKCFASPSVGAGGTCPACPGHVGDPVGIVPSLFDPPPM
jgi:hypothetical protein